MRVFFLSLINVVVDQESIDSLKILNALQTLKLHFVKIRRRGSFATCPQCLRDGHKLVDMILCKQCHSIESACCSISCYKDYHPTHAKECIIHVHRRLGDIATTKLSPPSMLRREIMALTNLWWMLRSMPQMKRMFPMD